MRCYQCPLCLRDNPKSLTVECLAKGEVNEANFIECKIGDKIWGFTEYHCLKAKNDMVDKMVNIIETMANK